MKREDWQKAYGPLPESLKTRVSSVLSRLDEETKPMAKRSLRTAAVVLALLLLLMGVAYAVLQSKTADIFGWFYGQETKDALLAGDIAVSGQTLTLGDVQYTLDEVIYKDGWIYGTGAMRALEGANVVLITEDYPVDESAGYLLFYGNDETVPKDAPSYADLARQRNAKILLTTCVANGVVEADGSLNASEIGFSLLPQRDGAVRFNFEFEGKGPEGQGAGSPIHRAPSYRLSLYCANWEVTLDGEWLREEPTNTLKQQDWMVEVSPEMAGGGR